jgi:hypothetical protein
MKIIKKQWRLRTTGLVGRVRRATAKKRKFIRLTTAAEVYGFQNLKHHLIRLGFRTALRRKDKSVLVVIGEHHQTHSLPRPHPKLRKALMNLAAGKNDCIMLTTPQEAMDFMSIRPDMSLRLNVHFRSARNCTAVMIWKK